MGHNGTGAQWDWDTTGLGHNGTGAQRDWDTTGLGHFRMGPQFTHLQHTGSRQTLVIEIFTWCFEPSQPQRITIGLMIIERKKTTLMMLMKMDVVIINIIQALVKAATT